MIIPLTGGSTWRVIVLVLILVVALALSASGHDLLTSLLLSAAVIGLCVDVVGRGLPEQKGAT